MEEKLLLDEFKSFMDKQILEIKKYKKKKIKNSPKTDSNSCVFEWIQKNAQKFREKWKN